jgi:hypothetical protein
LPRPFNADGEYAPASVVASESMVKALAIEAIGKCRINADSARTT